MSSVVIYRIDAEGVTHPYRDVPNAWAGARWIWDVLNAQHASSPAAIPTRAAILHPPCWDLCNDRALSPRDTLVCAFTFDGAWVAQGDLPALADALDAFYAEFGRGRIDPTLPSIASALRELAACSATRGACFHQTTVARAAWVFRDAADGGSRPFVFGRDPRTPAGHTPWNLFEDYGPVPHPGKDPR